MTFEGVFTSRMQTFSLHICCEMWLPHPFSACQRWKSSITKTQVTVIIYCVLVPFRAILKLQLYNYTDYRDGMC